MDYYSGAPEPNDYEFNNNGNYNNNHNKRNFFKEHSTLFLWILAIIIIGLIVIFFLIGNNGPKQKYNTEDNDSSLSDLDVYGGDLQSDFSSDVVRYDVVAYSDEVSFKCTTSSKKAKVEGCGEKDIVKVEDEEVEHTIRVIAENGSVTKYYFTIVSDEYSE